MKALMLLALELLVPQAVEPRGPLPVARKGTKNEATPWLADADQSSSSVDIIVDFGGKTVTGFPLPPVCELDQPVIREIADTTIFFTGCSPSDLTVSYSFLGTFDRKNGALEAGFKSTGDVTWTKSFSLKCKQTR